MQYFFLGVFLSAIMCGACLEDSADSPRVVQAQSSHIINGRECLLQKYFGPRYHTLQQGQVDEYWQLVRKDIQDTTYCFGDALTMLEARMQKFWSDPYARMQWVQDVSADLIHPLDALCVHDKAFTCESYFAGVQVEPGEGQMPLEHYQWVRKYSILSDIASYVALNPEEPSQPLSALHSIVYARQQRPFINDRAPFLSSKRGFGDLCQFYLSANLPEESAPKFVKYSRLNIRYIAYNFSMVMNKLLGMEGRGVLNPTGQVLMAERFAALQDKILLHGMPYMEKGVENLISDFCWQGSHHIFGSCLKKSCDTFGWAAAWKIICPREPYPFAYIIDKMHAQMKKVKHDPVEMLKIMMTFADGLSDNNCANVQSCSELIQALQNYKYYNLTGVWKDIMGTLYDEGLGEEKALEYVNGWHHQYFIKGVQEVLVEKGFDTHGLRSRALFAAEYNIVGNKFSNLWTALNEIARSGGKGALEDALALLDNASCSQSYICRVRSLLEESSLTEVRYGLWDVPFPFVRWNNALKVLVVFLPHKANMFPKVVEMQSRLLPDAICLRYSESAIRDFVSYHL